MDFSWLPRAVVPALASLRLMPVVLERLDSSRRWHARVALTLFFLSAALFVAVTLSSLRSGFADAADRGPGDVGLYSAEAKLIQDGTPYYDAVEQELKSRGYPTRSVFNWRTPLPVWLFGKLPSFDFAKALLGVLALLLLAASFHWLADDAGMRAATLAVLLLIGALLPCVLDQLAVMSELWCGVLIALSAVLFALGRSSGGVAAGVAALFFRELAAPYCLLCLVLAARGRRKQELAQWAVGLAAYGVFFACHVAQVLPRIGAADVAHQDGWLRGGGAAFLISTVQLNAFLLLLPQWVSAVYLACALLACANAGATSEARPAASVEGQQRVALTLVGYAVAFSFVGNDFNQYWGSVTAPLFCLAACRFPAVFRSLWRDASWLRPFDGRLDHTCSQAN